MARKKKPEPPEEHANHERWMLSYADMLTLLLALFIVMFAISKVDQQKFEQFAQGTAESFGQANLALQGQAGSLDGGDGILADQAPAQDVEAPGATPDQPAPLAQAALQREKAAATAAAAERQALEKVRAELEAKLAAAGLKNAVEFELGERGLVVNIVTDRVLFDTGKAALRPEGIKVLDAVAPILTSTPNRVTIEGHTDNIPISGTFASNWELSTARATTVLSRLLADGLPADRVSAAGYADQRPLASNAGDAGRSRNRRVAVVVLPKVTIGTPAGPTVAARPPTAG